MEVSNQDTIGHTQPRDILHAQASTAHTPWLKVSSRPVVSVEHPFIIKDIDKALKTLGDDKNLGDLVQGESKPAKLYLRPGDRMSKPIKSVDVKTGNVLLLVSVPKRTGRRRKKGSQGPYEAIVGPENVSAPEASPVIPKNNSTRYLIRALRDNPSGYQIQIVGTIGHTHRFRSLPDFATSTTNSPFMSKMRENILSFDYEKMKAFSFDMSKGVKPNTDIIPPPSWTHFTMPFNYSYHQNPSVKQVVDNSGNISIVNTQAAPKVFNQPVPFDAADIPVGPSPSLAPIEDHPPAMQRLIASARQLLEKRPIFTRRALANSIGDDWDIVGENTAKYAYQYAGYLFASGPWRDAIVRFGVDPRKDAKYRIYQTMMFMLESEPKDNRAKYVRTKADRLERSQTGARESHLFNGVTVSKDGKVWQVCDITDPLVEGVLATNNLRLECHLESDGWYHNGTWSKAKVLTKTKISAILAGQQQNHAAYERIARDMPDVIRGDTRAAATLGKGATPEEAHLATQIRNMSLAYRKTHERIPGVKEGAGEGDDDEPEEDAEMEREITLPVTGKDETIDPRLTEAASQLADLDAQASQMEDIDDETDVNEFE